MISSRSALFTMLQNSYKSSLIPNPCQRDVPQCSSSLINSMVRFSTNSQPQNPPTGDPSPQKEPLGLIDKQYLTYALFGAIFGVGVGFWFNKQSEPYSKLQMKFPGNPKITKPEGALKRIQELFDASTNRHYFQIGETDESDLYPKKSDSYPVVEIVGLPGSGKKEVAYYYAESRKNNYYHVLHIDLSKRLSSNLNFDI